VRDDTCVADMAVEVVDDILEGEGRLRLRHRPRIDRQGVLALVRRSGHEQWAADPSLLGPLHLNELSTDYTEAGVPRPDGGHQVTHRLGPHRGPRWPC